MAPPPHVPTELTLDPKKAHGRFQRIIERLVDIGGDYPYRVLGLAILALAIAALYTRKLELRTDFLELLPRDSPGFVAYEHQLGRVGGGATLVVVAESPDRAANQRFVDQLLPKLEALGDANRTCVAACPAGPAHDACTNACPRNYISYIESGTKDVHKFFEDSKWLYADLADLEDADSTLDHQIAIRSGLVTDLESGPAQPAGAASPAPENEKKPALGMDQFRERWKSSAKKHDDFPTGYFETAEGTMIAIRIVSLTSGTGDAGSSELMRQVNQAVASLNPKSIHPQMEVGLAGDIPNAQEEKESLMSDAVVATGISIALIVGGIVFYFRSFWSLFVIIIPAMVGVGAGYSFATAAFGYVNTAGLFLGAIIIGNGINYPIVLLSRYREFRARGQSASDARRNAVWNAFRAELVGASVAAIAYGSLTVTRFRGFSQFGMIGFVGMFTVWASMIPVVPALLVMIERIQERLPKWARDPKMSIAEDGTSGPVMKAIASVTTRFPKVFIAIGVVTFILFAAKLPSFLADPWEYNLSNLGSKATKQTGAGQWSNKADKIFQGKMDISGALMLADTPEQVPQLKEQILANDTLDPEGKVVGSIATIADLLPGTVDDQAKKLEVLDRIRDRLTPAVLSTMNEDEKRKLEELRPPDELKPIVGKDLPPLLRRRFEERNGNVGTVFYVKFDVRTFSDGHIALRIAKTTDNVKLKDGTVVQTASRSTIFAEMIRSMRRDGPLATALSFGLVVVVVVLATANLRGALSVLFALVLGVICTVGGGAALNLKLNFLNFIALPITFGIGSEYPFNIYDRARLLAGDVEMAVRRSAGAVALCSFTTIVGYGALIFNDNQALESFGKVAVAGEVACLLTALFILPALLTLIFRQDKRDEKIAG